MLESSSPEKNSFNSLKDLDLSSGMANRRQKAALVVAILWTIVITLHLVEWGRIFVLAVTFLLSIQAFRLVSAKGATKTFPPITTYPRFSLIVAGKNEELVIANVVNSLCNLDYANNNYEVWVVDDASTDRTGEILDELAVKYSHLHVIHRPEGSTGGKSGALNEILHQTTGDIIGVFDADAFVNPNTLYQVLNYFQDSNIGGVQLRKAISNPEINYLTRGQVTEMALDAYLQQQRIRLGGLGELRGNGQFVLRKALHSCGGWNEETITDDLDLSVRLSLDGWKIETIFDTPVFEEGVTNIKALWNQRNRWAEGGFQRYLDYWQLIFSNRMGNYKTFDLLCFVVIQYLLLTAAVPDFMMVAILKDLPILVPMTGVLGVFLPLYCTYMGLKSIYEQEGVKINLIPLLWQSTTGLIYTLHWLIVMPFVITKMALTPKKLRWVKTPRQGE